MTAASRDCGEAVLAALSAALRALDRAIDVVLVFRPDGEELVCTYASGNRSEYFTGTRLRIDRADAVPSQAALCGHHVELREPLRAMIPTDRIAMAIPMRSRDRLDAIVYVASNTARAFATRELLVRAISHAAVPYALALDREADRAQATYDGLTGLHTARAFRDRLQEDLRISAIGRPTVLSLWFIDTDNFKQVNDTLGHTAGDAVLQRIAGLLREHLVAAIDLGARNGGDEFCAIVRTHKIAAIERAQNFCDAVGAAALGGPIPITASVGVAAYPRDAATASDLLEIADAAMYHSKRSGRNRVSFAAGNGSFAANS